MTLLKENGIRIALNTNLNLADDDFIHFLKEHNYHYCTIQGCKDCVYSK